MAWIRTGTVNLTNGSNVVTGVGSQFLVDGRIGDGFRGPDGRIYEVINIATNVALTIQPNYEGPTVNGGTYFLAPFEGYVKDTADALRAASLQIAQIPGSKQDKSANLTAFAGLAGAADRLPYFTGAGALSLAVLTAKARELLALASEANMRTWLSLVPVTSATDRTPGSLLATGSGGILGVPVPIPNANNITFLGGTHGTFVGTEQECVAVNYPALGGAGTENRRWYLDTDFVDGTSARQTATESLGVGTTRGRTFTRVLATSWQPWVEVIKRGDFGIGSTTNPYWPDLNSISGTRAFVYGTGQTANMISGMDYGEGLFLNGPSTSDGIMLLMNHDSDRMFIKRKRGGNYSAGNEVFTNGNAVTDPANGGLMFSSVVNGWTIEKFLNGTMIMTGSVTSPTIAANTWATNAYTIPSGFVGEIYGYPAVQPLSTYDCYGVTSTLFTSSTSMTIGLRNGATAQAFVLRVMIKGRWKA